MSETGEIVMSKSHAQEYDWTPVRRGDIYCSPGCGSRCTHAAFEQSTRRAVELAERLGAGWAPYVWENMGWFGKAVFGDPFFLSVGWNYYSHAADSYHAYINGDPEGGTGGHWTAGGDTPEEAIQAALALFQAEQARLQDVARRLGDLDPRILGDYPGGIVAVERGGETVYFMNYRHDPTGRLNDLRTTPDPLEANAWNSPLTHARVITAELGLKAWPLPKPEEK